MNLKKLFVLVVLSSILYYVFLLGFVQLFTVEIDHVSTVNHIQDGDTFALESGHWVRLADVDTPERGEFGYFEAGEYLSDLIYGKKVYLDIDDVYTYDYEGTGDRLVCLVYVPFNSTHYLNVNKALLVNRYAVTYEFYNEFTPNEWRLYTPKLHIFTFEKIKFYSGVSAIILTIIIYIFYRKLSKFTSNTIKLIKNKIGYKPSTQEIFFSILQVT
ncbi:MAG: thermonuclease family protein [Candidatus Bathyarchaeota archaeon]|nr:thermonuclease family protein [Candidatus Bathyarchaeota archaeon]